MEYSAGVIKTAQPSYAIKLLSMAAERNEAVKRDKMRIGDNTEDIITNKGIILALMGMHI